MQLGDLAPALLSHHPFTGQCPQDTRPEMKTLRSLEWRGAVERGRRQDIPEGACHADGALKGLRKASRRGRCRLSESWLAQPKRAARPAPGISLDKT